MESVEAGLFNGRDVNKNVSATAACRLNKTVPFGRVEPLHCTLSHYANSDVDVGKMPKRLCECGLELMFLGGALKGLCRILDPIDDAIVPFNWH